VSGTIRLALKEKPRPETQMQLRRVEEWIYSRTHTLCHCARCRWVVIIKFIMLNPTPILDLRVRVSLYFVTYIKFPIIS